MAPQRLIVLFRRVVVQDEEVANAVHVAAK
jgi:hypothetical protein